MIKAVPIATVQNYYVEENKCPTKPKKQTNRKRKIKHKHESSHRQHTHESTYMRAQEHESIHTRAHISEHLHFEVHKGLQCFNSKVDNKTGFDP